MASEAREEPPPLYMDVPAFIKASGLLPGTVERLIASGRLNMTGAPRRYILRSDLERLSELLKVERTEAKARRDARRKEAEHVE